MTDGWTGARGTWQPDLPPYAASRIDRQVRGSAARSLLTAAGAAALATAELTPVGEVMGCVATSFARNQRGSSIRASHLKTRGNAYRTAVRRLVAEASALDADGVAGVQLTQSQVGLNTEELIVQGTAVRFTTPAGPDGTLRRARMMQPFVTELSPEAVATAVLSGWLPLGLVLGMGMAFVYEVQLRTGTGNTEIPGLTDVVRRARKEARRDLTHQAELVTTLGQVVISGHEVTITPHSSASRAFGYMAQAQFLGSVLQQIGPSRLGRPRSLSIMPLT